jgi:hypothetical protein
MVIMDDLDWGESGFMDPHTIHEVKGSRVHWNYVTPELRRLQEMQERNRVAESMLGRLQSHRIFVPWDMAEREERDSMFGKTATKTEPKALPMPVPKPMSLEEEVEEAELTEYQKLANAIGYTPAGIEAYRLETRLGKLGLQKYDVKEVHDFLQAQVKDKYHKWCWCPLRQQDAKKERSEYSAFSFGREGGSGAVAPWSYDKKVPLAALQVVGKVIEEFKDVEPEFFVSDYTAVNPDPFLAVRVGGEMRVIFHWDEPEWGLSKA